MPLDTTLTVTTPSDTEIAMTRAFDAAPARVFDAYTQPALLRGWLGGEEWRIDVCEVDLRVGGAYLWTWRNAAGKEMRERGTYREIVSGTRIVTEATFDPPWYPGVCVETIALAPHGDATVMTATLRYETRAARDKVLDSGMVASVTESYARFDAVLANPAHAA